jgi:hypothetical protein
MQRPSVRHGETIMMLLKRGASRGIPDVVSHVLPTAGGGGGGSNGSRSACSCCGRSGAASRTMYCQRMQRMQRGWHWCVRARTIAASCC